MENLKNNKARQPAYRQIAQRLRAEIVDGKYKAGSLLPSTRDLATRWHAKPYTVHIAMTTLAHEGWLERVNGAGTYVTGHSRAFRRAGIYHGRNIWLDETAQFRRNVHMALIKKLEAAQRSVETFTDERPPFGQKGTLLPSLQEAIINRRIDCVIAPTVDQFNAPVLDKLTIPTACIDSGFIKRRVSLSQEEFLQTAVHLLAQQGCRTIGAFSSVPSPPHPRDDFRQQLKKEVRSAGMNTREEWIFTAETWPENSQVFGYNTFMRLWRQQPRPQGLLVFSDAAVPGVIMAVLNCGNVVHEQMRFAFHRNKHSYQLCPFSAAWVMADEDLVAAALIEMIEKQVAGKEAFPVVVPYSSSIETCL